MKNSTKWIIGGISVIALGTGVYYLIQHLKKDTELIPKDDLKDSEDLFPADPPKVIEKKIIVTKSDFPIKLHSKGKIVKAIQTLLINKYGKDILGSDGADGDYGEKTYAALKSKGLPTVITKDNFVDLINKLKVESSSNSATGNKELPQPGVGAYNIASELRDAVNQKHISKAVINLKAIKNTKAYKEVNQHFKAMLINSTSKTIVTALLQRFTLERDINLLKTQFLRIGLRHDGDKWIIPN